MNSNERVRAALDHREADRVPYTDNPWDTTLERWISEGMPEEVSPEEYFDFEMVGFAPDVSFLLPEKIVEETDEYILKYNSDGTLEKNWKHATSTPELTDFSLISRKIWEERKSMLSFRKERIKWKEDKPILDRVREKGKYVQFCSSIGYDRFSSIIGPMTLLPALLTDPDWIYDVFETHTELVLNCAEEMFGMGYDFDGAFVFDDLGYKNGVFFSTEVYQNILQPHHSRLCDFFHERGLKVILHSCGNVKQHIPALIESGFDCLQALEVKAGMDVCELKKEYGDVLAFMGGIDVRKMAHPDPSVIEEEILTKVGFAKKGGGYIYHSDHSVPDNVSLERFKHIIDLVLKYGKY